jgi:ParB-like chromosome segregation protein Spo0J
MSKPIEIKLLPISSLKPHSRNSKLHPKRQVQKIAQSISEYGFNNPILLDSDNNILAGHGRYQAALQLQLESVPTICLGHLSASQARAYLIADNKVSESGYDTDILCQELFELSQEGFDGIDLGFDEDEMEKLMATDNNLHEEMNQLDENGGKIRVSPGQIWKIGKHTIHVGNRRLDLNKLCRVIGESDEPMTLYLVERQAQSVISHFEKAGNVEITHELGF